MSLEEIIQEIRERDQRDASRTTAPLVPADDAVLLDNSGLDIDATLARVLELLPSI